MSGVMYKEKKTMNEDEDIFKLYAICKVQIHACVDFNLHIYVCLLIPHHTTQLVLHFMQRFGFFSSSIAMSHAFSLGYWLKLPAGLQINKYLSNVV